MPAPNKAEREACRGAKDLFWQCMESNANDLKKCIVLREAFENACNVTQVKYFDRRRDWLKHKADFQEGKNYYAAKSEQKSEQKS